MFIDKWLFGSTRHELIVKSDDGSRKDLRGIFLDLLTLSKKDKGYIRANETTPYPTEQLAGMFCVSIDDLRLTIDLCLQHGKLSEPGPGIYYVNSTETYSLSDRWKREVTPTSENEEHGSENEEVRGEDIKGKDIKGKKKREDRKASRSAILLVLDKEPKRWEGITDADKALWAKTYPGCNVEAVLQEMIAYWDGQPPAKRKINWKSTIVNRFKWLQDHGGTNRGARASRQDTDSIIDSMKFGREKKA